MPILKVYKNGSWENVVGGAGTQSINAEALDARPTYVEMMIGLLEA